VCFVRAWFIKRRSAKGWQGEQSIGRFFGTVCVLGAATSWLAAAVVRDSSKAWIIGLAIVTAAKLARELSVLRLCPADADLNEDPPVAPLARKRLHHAISAGPLLRFRLGCAWLGGVILPLASLIPQSPNPGLAVAGWVLCLLGELAERHLVFFGRSSCRKCPGGWPHEPG